MGSSARRLRLARIVTDPLESARLAGLRYVSETGPGFRRRRAGRGFVYVDAAGRRVRHAGTLRRIRALVIPPAWTDVWICASPHGHIQAVGRDARGRRQYRYHARWRQVRDETKYARILVFARALPGIRRRVARDLGRPGLDRARVLATVVRLLETTLIRVGNEEYVRANGSFGLTTLRNRHVTVRGPEIRFSFRAKGGQRRTVGLRDPRLARIVRRLHDLPGQELFQYVDEAGDRQAITSGDVNGYLREIAGEEFTAKDFRTWAGTVLAALALAEVRLFTTTRQARRNIVRAVERVAGHLGNTPAICRSSYIHPGVLQAYRDGVTIRALGARTGHAIGERVPALGPEEGVVLGLLQQRAARVVSARAAA